MTTNDGGTITKRCVICGGDCAGQPRTKDRKGRYYHRACHARVAAERAAAAAPVKRTDELAGLAAEVPVVDLTAAAAAAPAAGSWLDDIPAAATGGSSACGGCGQPLTAGAAICTSCGTRADGSAVKTRKRRAKTVGGDAARPEWLAPLVGVVILGVVISAMVAVVGGTAGAGAITLGIIVAAVIGIWILVDSWRRSPLYTLGIIVGNVLLAGIPGMVYGTFMAEDRRLRGAVGGMVIASVMVGIAVGFAVATGAMDEPALLRQ